VAIDLRTALNEITFNAPEDNLAAAKGETQLATWADLPMVDLNGIAPDADFEAPGLHKRVRACLGNLLARSGDNVGFDWGCEVRRAPSIYADYDRVYFAEFNSDGSTWGSRRGAVVRLVWTTHVTGGGAIQDHPHYIGGTGMFGIGTDSEGNPAVAFRLFMPAAYDGREPPHPQVQSLWDGLVGRAQDEILERLQVQTDRERQSVS
jgi:hypothetical protein